MNGFWDPFQKDGQERTRRSPTSPPAGEQKCNVLATLRYPEFDDLNGYVRQPRDNQINLFLKLWPRPAETDVAKRSLKECFNTGHNRSNHRFFPLVWWLTLHFLLFNCCVKLSPHQWRVNLQKRNNNLHYLTGLPTGPHAQQFVFDTTDTTACSILWHFTFLCV